MTFTNAELGYNNQILPYTSTYDNFIRKKFLMARWSIMELSNSSTLDNRMNYYDIVNLSLLQITRINQLNLEIIE